MRHSQTRWQKQRSEQTGQEGFRREANSKRFTHYRPKPAQERWGDGRALSASLSLEGSWGKWMPQGPCHHPAENVAEAQSRFGQTSRAKEGWGQQGYSSEPPA